MRHKYAGYKLKRTTSGRDALLRNLATSIIEAERVVTTVPKAKAVRPLVEHMITLAKQDTLHSRRQAAMVLRTPDSVKKLFDILGTRFGQRNGGYTRIVRLGPRKGAGEARGRPGQAPRRTFESAARRPRSRRTGSREVAVSTGGGVPTPPPATRGSDAPFPAVFPSLVPSVYSCLSFLDIRQLRLLEVAFLLDVAKAGVHHFPGTPQAFGVRRKAGPWS